jgi:NitT/TauT family transport system substrate-binding protein
MEIIQNRRDFLAGLSAVGAAGVFGAPAALADEGPPEVTTIRLPLEPGVCSAPEQIADALLRAEGFTDIRHVQVSHRGEAVMRGEINFASETPAWLVSYLDAGNPITVLAGLHVGCYELFAHEPIRTISDLKGKRVGIPSRGARLQRAPDACGHGGACRARPVRGPRLDHHTPWRLHGGLYTRQG